MARIYIGRTTGIGAFERHVVLKLILPERADDSVAVSMFLDEARLAAMLNHQNVAQVFEVGEDIGIHYLAMEYVHGQDLRALLAKAGGTGVRVPLELGLTIVAGAAAGLNHAHERRANDGTPLGIVHRDVSPSNIMVGYDGSVKMLDFGIAKAAQRSVETVSGIIKGKFAYMSPEQCRGREVDRRSDVFSLGIILYEVTTQHRCFRADSDFDTMHRIVTGDVVKPTRLVPNYPPALEAIVLKALSVDPTQRFQSAGQLLEAIENYSLQNRSPLSTMALGRFMREMFGEIQEPWLVAGAHGVASGVAHHASEGTISNTQDRESDREQRYPAASPSGVQPAVGPPGATLEMTSDEIDHAMQARPQPTRREDDENDWSRARGYPVGSKPAIASLQSMPPEAVVPPRIQASPPPQAPRASSPQLRPHRDSNRTPGGALAPSTSSSPTIHGVPTMPVQPNNNTSSPGIPLSVGSSPGLQPPGPGPLGAPFPLRGPSSAEIAQPVGAMGSASGLPLIPNQPPPAGVFGGATTGSSSRSQVTPYPSVQDLDGYDAYESSLKPGRRGLYIGIGLAVVGLVIAIAIGRRGGGDGSTVPVAVTDPGADGSAGAAAKVDEGPVPSTGSDTSAATAGSAASDTMKPGGMAKPPIRVTPAPIKTDGAGSAALTAAGTGSGSDDQVATDVGDGSGSVAKPPEVGTGSGSAEDGANDRAPPVSPTTIKVVIKSDPSGAEVLVDGKRIGKTPFSTTLSVGAGSTPYTLHRDGFVDETVVVKHVKDFETTAHLDRRRSESSKTKPAATGTGTGKPTNPFTTPAKPTCQKRGGPIQPFGPKLPLCPE